MNYVQYNIQRHSSTRLGLSIVKGSVEAQHGNLTLENGAAGGSMFKIGFPALIMNTKEIPNE